MENEEKYNHLKDEKSPYLVQHAKNPVDWYPWGEQAFKLARSLDKPILLSIGYSTCHWCHVMERESFEDREVAEILNDVFVCIKVDREERPDVDSFYMHFCQVTTGSGGWPLNVILTPNLDPVFAMTYLPKHSRRGMMGIIEMANSVKELWQNNRLELTDRATETMKRLKEINIPSRSKLPEDIDIKAFNQFLSNYDHINGGFGGEPKFPTPHNLVFLMEYYKEKKDHRALDMVRNTLLRMRMGGIWDHVGGGFHRYSTDQEWIIPHFEKMLYDQALHLWAYASLYSVERKGIYIETCREIVHFLDSEMMDESGAYYTAIDADSEGIEGKYYLWTYNELSRLTGNNENFLNTFSVTERGNYHDQGYAGETALNILHVDPEIIRDPDDLLKIMDDYKPEIKNLKDTRNKRVRPHTDRKILADLNSLLAFSFMRSGALLGDAELIKKGLNLLNYIVRNMVRDTEVIHSLTESSTASHGFLDDYSFLVHALLTGFMINGDPHYLKLAMELNKYLVSHFMDDSGSLYFSDESDRDVPMRMKPDADGAIPSGSSFEILNLAILSELTGNADYMEKAEKILEANAGSIAEMPMFHSLSIMARVFSKNRFMVRYSADNHDPVSLYIKMAPFLSRLVILPVSSKTKYGIEEIDILEGSPFMKNGELQICSGSECLMPLRTENDLMENLSKYLNLKIP